jgi:mono/diheme cytochrome c family protein
MKRSKRTKALVSGMSLCWLVATVAYSSEPTKPGPRATPDQAAFFETKIRPVLAQNCLRCHGKEVQSSGLRLDSLNAMEKGGDSGPAVVPGDPAKSLLIQAVQHLGGLSMPPSGPKLTTEEITDLQSWVKMGAPWPEDAKPTGATAAPLWSLQPVSHPVVPKPMLKGWAQNPIDDFVLAKLEADHQRPNPPADRRTLIRRVYYDLIGLPPTDAEVSLFVADRSPSAYEKVVDQLLASPQYGEREARHWMDVARYADTKGYTFNEDRNYYSAYTYRDWLINAFNRDIPYDKFIVDQLAADRVPDALSDENRPNLAAMGYLTLGRRFLNQQPDIIDDRIDVTMRGMEGFTVGCARCHDHKFDPIPTQDYYSLYAVFASSEEKQIPISGRSIDEAWDQFQQKKTALEDGIRKLVLDQVAKLRTLKPETLNAAVRQQLQVTAIGAVPTDEALKTLIPVFEPGEADQLKTLQSQLEDLTKQPPQTPEMAMAMVDDAHPSDGVVFHHGNPNNRGIAAPRRFLLALSKPGVERVHWTGDSGRLELAESIASKDNPLTARVFVNRVWQDHFGAGIVRTPSDFGHQGEPPTDPKLLDYLASTFMDSGWSIKKLHRLIVTSATYCQSSDVSPTKYNADPDNRDWGRMNRRRLDLEQIRDSLMMAAGRLDLSQLGGKSVDLWSEPFTPRRAVYGFVERQNLPGIFRTFDFASPDSTSARRFQTTVPQQALFFMNSPFAIEEAIALASRKEVAGATSDGQRVRRLYQILFDRLPNPEEQQVGLDYLHAASLPAKANLPDPRKIWQYGFGGFDPTTQRESFTPFGHFDKDRYEPEADFPDKTLGYLTLLASGGHPGRDAAHATIRRWTSPYTGRIQISAVLNHGQKEGDGVRGRIVSSRQGLLGEWLVHNSKARTDLKSVDVVAGETIDFAVDCVTNDGYDSFSWAPIIRRSDGGESWNASSAFGPPPPPPLARVALYAQALMMTNEFMFID